MANKHYRVLKDTFLWKQGAILRLTDSEMGYRAIEDIWDSTPVNGKEYISTRIIEHAKNAEYFERVYPDTVTGKLFKTKDQLSEMYQGAFKS